MVNTVSKQTLIDGHRNIVFQVDIVGDGSGDESATSLVDISTFAAHPTRGTPTGCSIDKVVSTLEGFTCQLLWDATTDVEALLVGQTPAVMDFKDQGGLLNNAGSGKTGDINITTTGLGSGDQGTILLHLRKSYA